MPGTLDIFSSVSSLRIEEAWTLSVFSSELPRCHLPCSFFLMDKIAPGDQVQFAPRCSLKGNHFCPLDDALEKDLLVL